MLGMARQWQGCHFQFILVHSWLDNSRDLDAARLTHLNNNHLHPIKSRLLTLFCVSQWIRYHAAAVEQIVRPAMQMAV